jgi:hypothetical protein
VSTKSIYNKKYYLLNKEKVLKKHREYYLKTKNGRYERYKKVSQDYVKKNRKIISDKIKIRRNSDINFKLSGYLRNRVYTALKGIDKPFHTIELLGCSIEFFKKHLEAQFKDGMSWDNYGKWHVDHIRPCASFDLKYIDQQKQCFNYKNLQPLWAKDNFKKSSIYAL